MADATFHDYLGLARVELRGTRLVVFRGGSGSGKSSYIGWLLERHPALREAEVAVVDELLRPWDLALLLAVVRRSPLTLAASHLAGPAHALLRPWGAVRVYDLDRAGGKLRPWLERRGFHASEMAVAAYHRRFGGSYTEAEALLERYPGLSFDAALSRFLRECRVRSDRIAVGRPSVGRWVSGAWSGPEEGTRRVKWSRGDSNP